MREFITVGALNQYIAELLSSDPLLQGFWLKGEISGCKLYQQSGHIYFTLKDEDAAVSCVMFKSRAQRLKFKPEDGMEVLLRGYVSVFAKQGKYQVYAEEMLPFGLGGLYQYLEKLKARLDREGLFAVEHKQAIPAVVSRVGVVTSQDGAALRDILKVLRQRYPGVEVIIAHSSVQGVEAPRELAEAVQLLNEYAAVDVIIVARGGGSLEDLMAFNSEELVRAIYDSHIPVISGVGHEVDVSLCDLAADLRAATPTQAAQYAVPDYSLLGQELHSTCQRLVRLMQRHISYREEVLDRIMMKKIWSGPQILLERQKERLYDRQKALYNAMQDRMKEKGYELALAIAGLDKLSPLKVMQRGYALIQKDHRVISDIDQVNIGEEVQASLSNGRLRLEIKGKEKIRGGTVKL